MEIPNYWHVRVPMAYFFDFPDFKPAEIKVLSAIYKQTLGHDPRRLSAELSGRYLGAIAKIKNINSVSSALKVLAAADYISIQQPGRGRPQVITVNVRVSTRSESLVSTPSESLVSTPSESINQMVLNSINNSMHAAAVTSLMKFGLDENNSKELLNISLANGRSENYVIEQMGYVALQKVRSPVGLLITRVRQNLDVPPLEAPRSPQKSGAAQYIERQLKARKNGQEG